MALTVNTVGSSEGIVNVQTFFVTTDATTAVKTYFHCGFVPRRVEFKNLTDGIDDEWIYGMTADYARHSVIAGDKTLVTSGGITTCENAEVTLANSVVLPGVLALAPASGSQFVTGFSVPAALMVASKSFAVIATA